MKLKLCVIAVILALTASVSFAAGCGKSPFTVTFNGNGGTVHSGETVQSVFSADELDPPEFVRTGYTFAGWDTEIGGIKSSAVINAAWRANEYDIAFNSDGGEAVSGIKVVFGRSVGELPVPERQGEFIFSRWLFEKENAVITAETVWNYPENATLKAIWTEPEHYNINYNLGINGVLPADAPYDYTSLREVPLASPTRTGYIFDGWTGEGITEPQKNVVIPAGSTGEKTYTANWTAKTYAVTFDIGDGQETPWSMTFTFGQTVGKLPVPPLSDKFDGWYYGANKIKIDSSYIWDFDDNAPVLVAQYIVDYAVTFKLVCTVNNKYTVQCLYKGRDYIDPVYLSDGQMLGSKLVEVYPIHHKNADFTFEGWYYGNTEITKSTVFSSKIFGNNRIIELTVKCKLDGIWTDYY